MAKAMQNGLHVWLKSEDALIEFIVSQEGQKKENLSCQRLSKGIK